MWLKSDKFKPKHPGFWELAGGWEAVNHELVFSAGIFVSMPDNKGYTFFCESQNLSGIRDKKEWTPGSLLFVEVNRSTFKLSQKIGDQWVDVDTEPQKIEIAICEFLDSEKGKKFTEKPWKGRFTINSAEAFAELIPSMGIEVLLKNLEELPDSEKEKILPKSGGNSYSKSGKSGYSGMPPKDLALSRLEFIKLLYKEAYGLDELPSVETVTSLMQGKAADNSFQHHVERLIDICL